MHEMELCIHMTKAEFEKAVKNCKDGICNKGEMMFFGEIGRYYVSQVDDNNFSYGTPGKWKEIIIDR